MTLPTPNDSVGNVNLAPGYGRTGVTKNIELLASETGYRQDGVLLRVGNGVLEVGTPLVKYEDETWGPITASDRMVAATVTFTDSGDLVTTPTAHQLEPGDEVKFATISTTTGVTANTTYYVKTAPSGTTLTLSTTPGGSTVALTTDGTGTNMTQVETAGDVSGFLRKRVDTGAVGSIPKYGARVYSGNLKYSVIKAANNNTDLAAATVTALNARIDASRDYFIF